MFTVLIFPGGRRADAVILSSQGDHLRLAIAGRADITELTKIGGRWISENGIPIEFGALIALGSAGQAQPRTNTAGRVT